MDILVIILGIFGCIYNSFPLLMATLILSSIALVLMGACKKQGLITYTLHVGLYMAGVIIPLTRIFQ